MKMITAVAVALLLSTAAQAKETVLKQAGQWKAVITQNVTTGNPLCSMGIVNSDGRKFYIKYSDGRLFTQAFRTSWRFKDKVGTNVKTTIQFDDRAPREGVGHAYVDRNGYSFISILVSAEHENAFLEEIAEANNGVISFPVGDEKPWGLKMTGTREVSTAFRSCMATLVKRDTVLPQPTAKNQPSAPEMPDVVPMEDAPAKKKSGNAI